MLTLEELKKLPLKELAEELKKTTGEMIKAKLALASRQSKKTSGIKPLRKYIARIKTVKRLLPTK